jgi:hypothetical protein
MKIGVFGDSFADKNWSDRIWWQQLKTVYHHQVECFGECASSILFSAKKIEEFGKNFDLVIWAITSPNRISFNHNNQYHHLNSVAHCYEGNDSYVKKQFSAAHEFLTYLHDWDSETLVGKSLVSYFQQTIKNILIVPCFPPPLSSHFNLYNLCEWETKFYFPNYSIPEIYKKYQDLRPGHLTENTHRTLARLINDNLAPGIFQTDYNNFSPPTEKFNQCFKKIF